MKRNNSISLLLLLITVLLLPQCKTAQSNSTGFSILDDAGTNPANPYYVDHEAYRGNRSSFPIGIFDSGTGGLAVLEAILTLDEFNNADHQPGSDGIADFATESFIYLADEANMPYGKYDAENRADFLRELVIKDVLFLSGQKYFLSPDDPDPASSKEVVKKIVIACNTATAYGLESARSALDICQLPLTITGIIEAGAKAALETLDNKENSTPLIAVLATEGTCSSQGYPNTIYDMASTELEGAELAGAELKVIQEAGIGLAGAIDGDINYIDPEVTGTTPRDNYYGPRLDHPEYSIDKAMLEQYNFAGGRELLLGLNQDHDTVSMQLNSVRNYVRYMVTRLVSSSAARYPDRSIDAVILGCTHYPYEEAEIRAHFAYLREYIPEYHDIIPEDIVLIDPSRSLAVLLYEDLVSNNLLGNNSINESEFYISVPNPLLQENLIDENHEFPYAWKYGREINTGLQFVKIVPFSNQWISPEIRSRISEINPVTGSIL